MKRLMPQLMMLIIFSGICSINAKMQAKRRIMAGRSEKSHVVIYSRNGEVDHRAGALVVMRPWVEEEIGKSGSIVPLEDSRRGRKKNIVGSFETFFDVLFFPGSGTFKGADFLVVVHQMRPFDAFKNRKHRRRMREGDEERKSNTAMKYSSSPLGPAGANGDMGAAAPKDSNVCLVRHSIRCIPCWYIETQSRRVTKCYF